MRVIKCVGRKGHKLWRCPLVPSFAVVVSGRSNNFSEAVEISYGTSTGPAQRLVISSLCLLGTGTDRLQHEIDERPIISCYMEWGFPSRSYLHRDERPHFIPVTICGLGIPSFNFVDHMVL